jgi:hypothetical protein
VALRLTDRPVVRRRQPGHHRGHRRVRLGRLAVGGLEHARAGRELVDARRELPATQGADAVGAQRVDREQHQRLFGGAAAAGCRQGQGADQGGRRDSHR